ncbi:MAG: PAS domain S-box protein [Candidatus Zixiibacteriota bacterium]|nr:MAG: PAS domain S-box protein [candidate division Zixibacteria bacterium]
MKLAVDDVIIRDIAKLGRLSPYIHMALAAIVVSLIYPMVSKSQLIIWILVVIVINLVRLSLQLPFIGRRISLKRYFHIYSIFAILQGFIWGLSVVYFSGSIPTQYEVFLIFIGGGGIAAAVPLLSPILRFYVLYALSIMGPIIIHQFLKGDQFSYTVTFSCVTFLAAMIFAAINVNRNFRKLRETKSSLDNQIAFVNSIYNSALDVSFITCDMNDENCRILSFSSGSESIFGYRKDEVVGMPLNFLFNKDAFDSCREMLKEIKSGRPVKREIDLVKKIGVIHNLSVSIYPLFSNSSIVDTALIICTDISESRHTEEALINSEEKFRNIVESSPMGIHMYQLDPRGRLVLIGANNAADKMTGVDNQRLIGLTIEQAFPSLIETEVPDIYKRVAAEGTSWQTNQIQYADKKADGAFEVHAFQTSPGKMVAMFVEVTERIKAEKALRDSEKRFRDIALSSSDWIWEIDAAGKFTYVSEGVKSVIGYEPEELIGKSMFDIVSQDETELVRELFIMVLSRKQNITDWVSWNTHKDGPLICIQSNGVPIIDINGKLTGYRGINKDITSQKRSEERLRQSEERYRTLIESMEEGLLIVSTDTVVIFSNEASSEIFGLPQEEIIGSNFDEIVANKDLPKIYNNILNQRNRNFRKNEVLVERLDGQKRHILLSANVLKNHDGNILGSFGILTDITELKRAEKEKVELREQLTNAQRMESLGILAGGVAHDLNNILGPLVAYPDLIKTKLEEDHPVLHDIMKIKKSAERAAGVVQDLLTLARRGRYELAPVDMGNIIDSYLKSPEFTVIKSQHPDVTMTTDLNENTPIAYGSEPHLLKIIMNLIINAMDAMPGVGELRIKLDYGYIDRLIGGFDNLVAGNYIIFTVSDTGMGIEKNDMKHIFEPFYSKKKMGRSGSGLGLSIVYGIVKDHNGYIDVKSEVDKGSDFVVYLPLVETASKAEDRKVIDIRGNEKILVVDDMEEQRELAATILTSMGYNIITAVNGREAVEYLKTHRVDLVVLDMIMEEDFDGLDTYEEIIKIHPGQKAIIASGFSETDRVREAEKLGVARYIRKPYNMQILGKAIREILSQKEAQATKA